MSDRTAYAVTLTTDKLKIHAFLQRDPVYAAYAIGDLEDAMFGDTAWYLVEADGAARGLVLLYSGLEPPILLTMGEVDAVAAALATMPLPERMYMAAQCDHLPAIERNYDFSADRVRHMVRMTVTAETFRAARDDGRGGAGRGDPAPTVGANDTDVVLRRLGAEDLAAVETLYRHGGSYAPDAFHPRQVVDGVFYGVLLPGSSSRDEKLLSVAGTHLIAPNWGVAAVGNIYTHPTWRGQGLARQVTSAVTQELLDRDLLVVLNVDQSNAAAIHIYQSLGYRTHCPYVEGVGSVVVR